MKKVTYIILILSNIALTTRLTARETNEKWPVLKTYDQQHIDRIAMPVGGIGTGTVSLSGYGAIIDWEIQAD